MQDKLILLPTKQFEIVVWRLHAMSHELGARLLFPTNFPPYLIPLIMIFLSTNFKRLRSNFIHLF